MQKNNTSRSSMIIPSRFGLLLLVLVLCLQINGCTSESTPESQTALPAPGQNDDSTGPQSLLPPLILPFDTTDDSLVFRSSLTSIDAITNAGGMVEPSSENTFDPLLGMKPGSIPGGMPGVRFTSSTIADLADIPSGQISIEVEREWLAVSDPEVRSTGYTHTNSESLLSYGAFPASNQGGIVLRPEQQIEWSITKSEGTRTVGIVNTPISDRFARITISWSPSKASLYIDGLKVADKNRTDPGSDRFSSIYIGNFLGTAVEPFAGPFFVRNLIVASKPVEITAQPLLSHMMLIGDSFAAGQPFFNKPRQYDGTIINTVIKQLVSNGAGFDNISVFSNGGGQIQDNGADPLEMDVGKSSNRADALALNPSLIYFVTGGNDFGIFDAAQFTSDLHDHIEAFLGVNGHPDTTTQYVIVTTTASNAYAGDPAILNMNEIIRDLPAWWNTNYPSRAGSVSVVDTWRLFGGKDVDSSLFGINDTVHPAASGNIVYGKAIAAEILRLIYQID